MNMTDEKEVMLREIEAQPEFVMQNVEKMRDNIRNIIYNIDPTYLKYGFIIGCGDSFFAGLAVRQYMMKLTGRMVEPIESLEFSHYLMENLPDRAFVLGVSNSGTVSRTIEGIKLARGKGAKTFGVTANDRSTLAETAEALIKVGDVPNIKEVGDGRRIVTPGTLTYTASILALYISSSIFGERFGQIGREQADKEVDKIRRIADAMAAAQETVADVARDIAATFTAERQTVMVGGGPNYATAHFAAAKWFEGLTRPAHIAQLEEWAHEQYFMTDETVDTFIILPPGAGRGRGLEQAQAARDMGSRTILVGASNDDAAKAAADIFFPMPPDIPEDLTPFVYKLPFEYLSCQIALKQNISFLGFDNKKRQEVNFRQIFNSAHASDKKAGAS